MCSPSSLFSTIPYRGLAPASLLPPDEADLVEGALSVLGLVPHQVGGAGWGWCHTRWVGQGGARATPGRWVGVGRVRHK